MNRFLESRNLKVQKLLESSEGIITYEAIDLRTKLKMIVKIIEKRDVGQQKFQSCIFKWKTQMKLFQQNESKHFARIYEIYIRQNIAYVVFEKGSFNFSEVLDRNKTLSLDQVFDYLLQILIGICHLKSLGFVHCNLTPACLQVGIISKKLFVSGLDYCVEEAQLNNSNIKQKFKLFSNLKYLAPQLLNNNNFITQKSMVWNIGILLYYMLFQKYPFQAYTHQKYLKLISCSLKIPSTDLKDYIPLFTKILRGCLDPDQNQRFTLTKLLSYTFRLANINQKYYKILKSKQDDIILAIKKLQCYPNIFLSIGQEKVIDNNIDYVYILDKFYQMINFLEIQIKQIPMQSLTKYMIKCRVNHLVNHKVWLEKDMINYQSLQKGVERIIQRHKQPMSLQLLNQLNHQKFAQFRNNFHGHREIVYMHFQVFLREFIIKSLKKIFSKVKKNEDLDQYQYNINALQTALYVFQINGKLIQSIEQCNWVFMEVGEIQNILHFSFVSQPTKLFKNCVNHILHLDILDDQGFQKQLQVWLPLQQL